MLAQYIVHTHPHPLCHNGGGLTFRFPNGYGACLYTHCDSDTFTRLVTVVVLEWVDGRACTLNCNLPPCRAEQAYLILVTLSLL